MNGHIYNVTLLFRLWDQWTMVQTSLTDTIYWQHALMHVQLCFYLDINQMEP